VYRKILYFTHVVPVRILVRPFTVYGARRVQHGPVFGGPESRQLLARHVRRQHFGPGGRLPKVLRARERVRPRVRRYRPRVTAGRVRCAAAVTVRVAHSCGAWLSGCAAMFWWNRARRRVSALLSAVRCVLHQRSRPHLRETNDEIKLCNNRSGVWYSRCKG